VFIYFLLIFLCAPGLLLAGYSVSFFEAPPSSGPRESAKEAITYWKVNARGQTLKKAHSLKTKKQFFLGSVKQFVLRQV
jgi:hypothetical protein